MCTSLFPAAEVALRIVSAEQIRELNRNYRGVDEATDVLSFPAAELRRPLTASELKSLCGHAGDIALAWDFVVRQARANANTPVAEALALLAHGLLHLAGYEHRDDAEQLVMDRLTRDLCREVGIEVQNFGH
jgi:probable rRNA maturation factor